MSIDLAWLRHQVGTAEEPPWATMRIAPACPSELVVTDRQKIPYTVWGERKGTAFPVETEIETAADNGWHWKERN